MIGGVCGDFFVLIFKKEGGNEKCVWFEWGVVVKG